MTTMPPPKKETKKRADAWSRAVFAMYGRRCWMHLRKNPRSKVAAHQAAHIIKRSRMGAAIAYGPKDGPLDPRLGRPLCYDCHKRQEPGTEFAFRFPYPEVLEAITLHNSWAKQPLPMPDPKDYPE